MSGVNPWLGDGPATYEVSASVAGGQLVVADGTTGKVKPSTGSGTPAGDTNVLGVALSDAEPAGTNPTNPLNIAWPTAHVGVAHDVDIRVTYAGAATLGQLLVAAASGQVKAYTAASNTFDQIVGRCTEPAGVSGAGVVARARIF